MIKPSKYFWSLLCTFCVLGLVLATISIFIIARSFDAQPGLEAEGFRHVCFSGGDIDRISRHGSGDLNTAEFRKVLNDCLINATNQSSTCEKVNTTGQTGNWSAEAPLTIYVVLHSHNDPGWLRTFEEYYGSMTRDILNNIVEKLPEKSGVKFTWSELAFLDLWWNEANASERDALKKLLEIKQLEIVGGGWVMPDEASTHYLSLWTQLIEGHQWLLQNFNFTPNIGWTIDPFGLSPTMAYFQKEAGYNMTIITRVHYFYKTILEKGKNFEFNWRQSWDTNGETDLLTHVMPSQTYDTADTCGPDHFFCQHFNYDIMGDFMEKKIYNETDVGYIALGLLHQLQQKALSFGTNHVLWPIGGDFRWRHSAEWDAGFAHLQACINFINSRKSLHTQIKFSTLEEYHTALLEAGKATQFRPKTLVGDFFPYSDSYNDYWTGYYTSRIFHKVTERQLMSLLRSAQLAFTLLLGEVNGKVGTMSFPFVDSLFKRLVTSRRISSLFQHHDGITGTSKEDVSLDYARKLDSAISECNFVIQQCLYLLNDLERLATPESLNHISEQMFLRPVKIRNDYLDVWSEELLEVQRGKFASITVFNPLATSRTELIKLNVSDPNVKVTTSSGDELHSEIFPHFNFGKATRRRPSKLEIVSRSFELVFAAQFEPFEIRSFGLVRATREKNDVAVDVLNTEAKFDSYLSEFFHISSGPTLKGNVSISNRNHILKISKNGTLMSVTTAGNEIPLNLTFAHYTSYTSGLYIFGVDTNTNATPVNETSPATVVVKGTLQHYMLVFFNTVIQRITLADLPGLESSGIDLELLVDVQDRHNYELVMRLEAGIESNNTFYTDSNGFQMMKRKYWPGISIPGNYFPVASSAFIEDSQRRITLLTGQPGGATSLKSGQLEIMVDRTTEQDDYRGVDQYGEDNKRTILKFKILVEKPSCAFAKQENAILSLEAQHHLQSLLHPANVFWKKSQVDEEEPSGYLVNNYEPLPCDIIFDAAIPLLRVPSDNMTNYGVAPGSQYEVGLIFHRMGFDPCFSGNQLIHTCALDKECLGKVKIVDVFGETFAPNFQRTSLNFIQSKGEVDREEAISLKPMELLCVKGSH